MVVESGQEADPRGPALGRIVGLGVTNPVARQAVKVGRTDFPAVTPEVGPAHIVHEKEQYIRT